MKQPGKNGQGGCEETYSNLWQVLVVLCITQNLCAQKMPNQLDMLEYFCK